MTTQRILITGSRDWPDAHAIETALMDYISDEFHAKRATKWILVHGACPTGADKMAADWGERTPRVTVESHPADWNRHGKKAGFVRNQEMVHLGADVCFAFIKDDSKGATMTERMARSENIRTITNRITTTPFKGGFNDFG